jgi:hypothetical protein
MNEPLKTIDPKVAAQLEEYYHHNGGSVPSVLVDQLEASFLPATEGTLQPGETVLLPAPSGDSISA